MTLVGAGFAFFLPMVLIIYWTAPRRAWIQNLVLLLASAVFYATWNVRLLPLLAACIVVNWAISQIMAGRVGPARKTLLAVGITIDLALLGLFKYAGFFAGSLNDLLMAIGLPSSLPILQIALPLGISYTTLIRIGYLLDVYYERRPPERSLLNFAIFVGFFAHLVAGPIVRSGAMLPQYAEPRRLRPDNLSEAALVLLFGYTLKAYVSERMAAYVTPVFNDPDAYGMIAHWIGLFAYALQLFSDFSGYSLMAIGVGLLFGLRLPENFRAPFLSTGMLEFWRRWHISLNSWLFDYLFYPWTTGRGRLRGRIVTCFFLVFLISGIWHGAAWTFVLWGMLHGCGLAVQHGWDQFYKGLCRADRKWVERRRSTPYKLAAWMLTQGFFVLTLLPFRSPSLEFMLDYLRGMFTSLGEATLNLGDEHLILCLAFLVAWHLAEFEPGRRIAQWFRERSQPLHGLMCGAALVFLALFVPAGAATFIYANF